MTTLTVLMTTTQKSVQKLDCNYKCIHITALSPERRYYESQLPKRRLCDCTVAPVGSPSYATTKVPGLFESAESWPPIDAVASLICISWFMCEKRNWKRWVPYTSNKGSGRCVPLSGKVSLPLSRSWFSLCSRKKMPSLSISLYPLAILTLDLTHAKICSTDSTAYHMYHP